LPFPIWRIARFPGSLFTLRGLRIHALKILCLHQEGLDTTTPAGVFAEFERAMIQEHGGPRPRASAWGAPVSIARPRCYSQSSGGQHGNLSSCARARGRDGGGLKDQVGDGASIEIRKTAEHGVACGAPGVARKWPVERLRKLTASRQHFVSAWLRRAVGRRAG
jgi:hypothetical protein